MSCAAPPPASMRPPLNAGENKVTCFLKRKRERSFNEAPAERGGKPAAGAATVGLVDSFNEAPAERGGKPPRACAWWRACVPASMRPPLNAGENHPTMRHVARKRRELQ